MTDELRSTLLERARALGADLAGIASVNDLRRVDDVLGAEQLDRAYGVLSAKQPGRADDVAWPEGALSVLVIAVSHPLERPEMDWWFGRSDPPGNRVLAGIVQSLCDWIPGEFGFRAVHLPYHVERGGTYLKDAAVLAGLGRIGLNNLLVTREYGPRVRLRALTLDVALPPTGPALFDPCAGCDAPCRSACPQNTFLGRTGKRLASGVARLPARTGEFSRAACMRQMDLDLEAATIVGGAGVDATAVRVTSAMAPAEVVRYCRACELTCPAGL
jgi:epoxyqueuosine reductase